MTRRRRMWRFVTDWRNGLTFVASAVVAMLGLFVYDSVQARNDFKTTANVAAEAAKEAAATQRVSADRASARITQLQAELAAVRGDVEALREQTVRLGADPVVPIRRTIASPPTTAARSRGRGQSSTPATTAVTVPPPTPRPSSPPTSASPPTTRCLVAGLVCR